MSHQFLTTADDVQWLKDTALKGVPLPAAYAEFKSAILQGNEDAPYALNLYTTDNPTFKDDYLRVRFPNDGLVYAVYMEYNGTTSKPYGGFTGI